MQHRTSTAPTVDTRTALDTLYLGNVVGLLLAGAGELISAAPLTLFGLALVALCLPTGLLLMTWNLLRATGRYARTVDHVVEARPRT